MGRYAKDTAVSVEQSRAEIEKIVRRYGADGFASAWQGNEAIIQFICKERRIKFHLVLPNRNDRQFTQFQHRVGLRTQSGGDALWEQACRQRWRALCLLVKAKLEAVESGITTFESEFLANIVMSDGQTVYQRAKAGIALEYQKGTPQNLLTAS